MEYVEFLRVRRAFTIFALIVVAFALIVIASAVYSSIGKGHVLVEFGDTPNAKSHDLATYFKTLTIPLGLLLGLAGYIAIVFASVLASSLNKERDGLDYVFVKPIRREEMALRYIATDIVGIVAIFASSVVIELATLAVMHVFDRIVIDSRAFWVGGLGLGVACMWYGILQAVTATYRGKGSTIVGISWGIFGLLVGIGSITALGPVFSNFVHTLNLINPIAYFSRIVSGGGGTSDVDAVFGLSLEARVCFVWAIAWAGMAIAAFSWRRVEA